MDEDNSLDQELLEQEYSSVEVSGLIQAALDQKPILNHSWLETRIYEELFPMLSEYMNKADVTYMLWSLRSKFLEGFTKTTPVNLQKVCSKCRTCSNVTANAVDPIWNSYDPDLMIIVANPAEMNKYGNFLATALKESGFKSDRCMVTYMTRCPLENNEVLDSNIVACAPYVLSEINACNPKLIVPMGTDVWGAVSGDVIHKISDMEGNLTWIGLFPYLPTKSLGFYQYQMKNSNKRNVLKDVLSTAHHFLYASEKNKTIDTAVLIAEGIEDVLEDPEE